MAGSYEHIRRTNKPTNNTAESYGGLDTSLVENMGDAIEAMVHMWWMIQILANGNKAAIRAASKPAGMIEVGRQPPVDVVDPESLVKISRLATVQTEVGFQWPGRPVPGDDDDEDDDDGPPDVPGWHATANLRFVRRESRVPAETLNGLPTATIRYILQQGFEHTDGRREWTDVPTVDEGK